MPKHLRILLAVVIWLLGGPLVGLLFVLLLYLFLGEGAVRLQGGYFFKLGVLSCWLGSCLGYSFYFLRRKLQGQRSGKQD
jgi:hypothetical protein